MAAVGFAVDAQGSKLANTAEGVSGRILVVEDDADLAFVLRNSLEFEGYVVDLAPDGLTGLNRIPQFLPDLIVLDLLLPDLSGFAVLRRFREGECAAPVLVLTALEEEADKIRAFDLGADDYVVKPVGLRELRARVEALLRRAGNRRPAKSRENVLAFGDIEIDLHSRSVRRAGKPATLSPREFDLLLVLARSPGRVFSRQELLRLAWGHRLAVATRTVDTHINGLRRQLERDPSRPRHIVTVPKAGYRLDS